MRNQILRIGMIVSVLFLISLTVYGQNRQPPAPMLPEAKPQGVPIDGGLSILALAGGAYAIKKLRDKSD